MKTVAETVVRNSHGMIKVSEKEHTVYVADVIYAGSDQSKWLEQMPVK